MNYTQEELEEAKAYLRDRLRNQRSMSRRIEELLVLYAEYLLNALFSSMGGNVDNDIELLVQDLIEQIWDDCILLAQDEHDRKPLILAYINRDIEGDNLRGRISSRVRTYAAEVMAVYAAGRLTGYTYQAILSSIKENLRDPWHNPIITEAREKGMKGEVTIPDAVDLEEPSYGQGVAVSSLTALDLMTEFAIGEAWNEWQWLDARDKGAKGYFVERGSSYPCDTCDSHTGIFYDIKDEDNKPLYHPHCCCVVIYSYVERL